MADETTPVTIPVPENKTATLAQESGVNLQTAMAAIAELNAKFAAQNDENQKLRNQLVALQAQQAKQTAQKFGSVEIQVRHCNTCGTEVGEGERCPKPGHKRSKINEVGMGTLHNRVQPIIVRQV